MSRSHQSQIVIVKPLFEWLAAENYLIGWYVKTEGILDSGGNLCVSIFNSPLINAIPSGMVKFSSFDRKDYYITFSSTILNRFMIISLLCPTGRINWFGCRQSDLGCQGFAAPGNHVHKKAATPFREALNMTEKNRVHWTEEEKWQNGRYEPLD